MSSDRSAARYFIGGVLAPEKRDDLRAALEDVVDFDTILEDGSKVIEFEDPEVREGRLSYLENTLQALGLSFRFESHGTREFAPSIGWWVPGMTTTAVYIGSKDIPTVPLTGLQQMTRALEGAGAARVMQHMVEGIAPPTIPPLTLAPVHVNEPPLTPRPSNAGEKIGIWPRLGGDASADWTDVPWNCAPSYMALRDGLVEMVAETGLHRVRLGTPLACSCPQFPSNGCPHVAWARRLMDLPNAPDSLELAAWLDRVEITEEALPEREEALASPHRLWTSAPLRLDLAPNEVRALVEEAVARMRPLPLNPWERQAQRTAEGPPPVALAYHPHVLKNPSLGVPLLEALTSRSYFPAPLVTSVPESDWERIGATVIAEKSINRNLLLNLADALERAGSFLSGATLHPYLSHPDREVQEAGQRLLRLYLVAHGEAVSRNEPPQESESSGHR